MSVCLFIQKLLNRLRLNLVFKLEHWNNGNITFYLKIPAVSRFMLVKLPGTAIIINYLPLNKITESIMKELRQELKNWKVAFAQQWDNSGLHNCNKNTSIWNGNFWSYTNSGYVSWPLLTYQYLKKRTFRQSVGTYTKSNLNNVADLIDDVRSLLDFQSRLKDRCNSVSISCGNSWLKSLTLTR